MPKQQSITLDDYTQIQSLTTLENSTHSTEMLQKLDWFTQQIHTHFKLLIGAFYGVIFLSVNVLRVASPYRCNLGRSPAISFIPPALRGTKLFSRLIARGAGMASLSSLSCLFTSTQGLQTRPSDLCGYCSAMAANFATSKSSLCADLVGVVARDASL